MQKLIKNDPHKQIMTGGQLIQFKQKKEDLLTRYRLIERIHSGGQGRIDLAERLEDAKVFILKRYNDVDIEDWDDFNKASEGAAKEIAFLYRARDEGRTDLPMIIEHGITGDLDEPVMVMEQVNGKTLEYILARVDFNPKIEDALELANQVATTLRYAHEEVGTNPFIHRDLRPANIIRNEEGNYVVLDWSTGKIGGGNTARNTIFNSLFYTSPEVEFGRSVSKASDVYSLGRILQHYILGGEFVEKDGKITREDFQEKNIPPHVVDVLFRATAEEKVDRYQSMEELTDAFEKPPAASPLVKSETKSKSKVVVRKAEGGFLEQYASTILTTGILPIIALPTSIRRSYEGLNKKEKVKEEHTSSQFTGVMLGLASSVAFIGAYMYCMTCYGDIALPCYFTVNSVSATYEANRKWKFLPESTSTRFKKQRKEIKKIVRSGKGDLEEAIGKATMIAEEDKIEVADMDPYLSEWREKYKVQRLKIAKKVIMKRDRCFSPSALDHYDFSEEYKQLYIDEARKHCCEEGIIFSEDVEEWVVERMYREPARYYVKEGLSLYETMSKSVGDPKDVEEGMRRIKMIAGKTGIEWDENVERKILREHDLLPR